MAVEDLGTIRYSIEADHAQLDEADEATDRYRKTAKDAEKGNAELGNSFRGMATAVRIAAAAVGGLTLGRIIRESADFEQQMLRVRATSQATGEQFDQLTEQARTLGATTIFSAQQAAEAQQFLAQAGFEVNEVLSATPGVLQLATAANIDLGQAADIASNALSGFRLPVEDLNRVNDILANTAASANTSVSQLGRALSFAAPIATGAGVSIEETAGAIGALSDAGLQASRAGTGFVGVIRQLSRVTPQAEAILKEYGLTMADVDITTRGLQPVLEDLQAANLSTSDTFAVFGSEAGAAAQILTGTSERVGELTESNQNATGAAKDMADIMGSGLRASLRSLNSAVSEAVLQMGDSEDGLGGALLSVVDAATGVISVYNGMLPEFVEANDLTEEQAQNLELMAAALKAIGAGAVAIAGVTTALKAAAVAQAAFNAVARANPYILLATAVAGAGAALYSFISDMDETGERSRALNREIEELTEGYDGLTKAQAENELQSVSNRLSETRRETMQARIELQRLQEVIENSGQLTPQGGAMAIATPEDIKRAEELKNQIDDAEVSSEALWKAYEKAEERLKSLQGTASSGGEEGGGDIEPPTGVSDDDLEKQENKLRASLATQSDIVLGAYLDRQMEIENLQERGRISDEESQALRLRNFELYTDEMARIASEGSKKIVDEQQSAIVQTGANIVSITASQVDQMAGLFKEAGAIGEAFYVLSQGLSAANAIIHGLQASMAIRLAYAEMAALSANPALIGIGETHANLATVMGFATAAAITAQTVAGARRFGGQVQPGQQYLVGEDGPEVLKMGGSPGHVTPNHRMDDRGGNAKSGDVTVNVHNAPAGTRTEERTDSQGNRFVEVFLADVARGGRMSSAMQSTFGLKRQGR